MRGKEATCAGKIWRLRTTSTWERGLPARLFAGRDARGPRRDAPLARNAPEIDFTRTGRKEGFRGRGAGIIGALLFALAELAAAAEPVFGPNLATNPDFEQWADGKPVDWRVNVSPADAVRVSSDTRFRVSGASSLKIEIPAQGHADISSKGILVEPGARYLFSLAFRSEGFGEKGKYSGVDSSARIIWLDASGKQIGSGGILGLPYHAVSNWDLRDVIVTAPPVAATAVVSCGFGNNSGKQAGKGIPSTLWLDAFRLLRYTPPHEPEEAKRKVEKIVEGGWDNSIVKSYNLSSLRYGKFSEVVQDSAAADGSCLKALTTEGNGLIAHSPAFSSPRPGLYRIGLRAKTASNSSSETLGRFDIASENSSSRGGLELKSGDFAAAGGYQDFSFDFILRAPGWWHFTVGTQGKAEWFADTVRIYPLKYFSDQELIETFPGMEGAVPETLLPGTSGTNSALLVAGPYYDYWGIADALHLARYPLTTVFVRGGRSQTFTGFSETAEALFAHKLIVLCGVDLQSMSLTQKKMILEFTKRGGGLLLLGGHKAFDRGGVQNSLLAELLPVTFETESTGALAGEGRPALLAKGPSHPLTEFLHMVPPPVAYWWHQSRTKEGAMTILSTEKGDPAVAVGASGKGRVACVLATCHGAPAPGQAPFWEWEQWPLLLRDLCRWTAHETE